MRYGELATCAREFVGNVQGPSLDMMGTSLELLKYEGLIEPIVGEGMTDDAEMAVTVEGKETCLSLLQSPIRTSPTDLNRLVIALKFRFIHLLELDAQKAQADQIIDAYARERERLAAMRAHPTAEQGHLGDWLDHDAALLDERLLWLKAFRKNL